MRRPRVGDAQIDHGIGQLEMIDDLANDLFRRAITAQEFRQQFVEIVAAMDDVALSMFCAPYIVSDEEVENFYGELQEQGEARAKSKLS